MSLTGPEALRSLDEALRDIRREEDEIAKRLARSAELMTKLREQEGETCATHLAGSGRTDVVSGQSVLARHLISQRVARHALANDQQDSPMVAFRIGLPASRNSFRMSKWPQRGSVCTSGFIPLRWRWCE